MRVLLFARISALQPRRYDQLTQENKVATATKTTAVEYKEKDGKETAALLAGYESDRGVAQEELDAILEYWEKLQPMCVAKARGDRDESG